MICASLCLLLLIRFPLSFVQNRIPFRTVYGGDVTMSIPAQAEASLVPLRDGPAGAIGV